MYLERRILGRLYGESVLQFNAAQGRLGMQEAVALFGADNDFTALCPDLTVDGGVDPDDAFSRIPYEKGFHFIYYLQASVDTVLGLYVAQTKVPASDLGVGRVEGMVLSRMLLITTRALVN